jgi:hypothetical protein
MCGLIINVKCITGPQETAQGRFSQYYQQDAAWARPNYFASVLSDQSFVRYVWCGSGRIPGLFRRTVSSLGRAIALLSWNPSRLRRSVRRGECLESAEWCVHHFCAAPSFNAAQRHDRQLDRVDVVVDGGVPVEREASLPAFQFEVE